MFIERSLLFPLIDPILRSINHCAYHNTTFDILIKEEGRHNPFSLFFSVVNDRINTLPCTVTKIDLKVLVG